MIRNAAFAIVLLVGSAVNAATCVVEQGGAVTFVGPPPVDDQCEIANPPETAIDETQPANAALIAAYVQGPNPTTITKTAFWARFTQAEQLAVLTAVAAPGASQSNASVAIWNQTAQTYSAIDLTDPLTKQGLDVLVVAGILTSARETAILTP